MFAAASSRALDLKARVLSGSEARVLALPRVASRRRPS
jgi:hypothetical protein